MGRPRPMTILVTGAAGFIGFHVANALLDRGEAVIGLDNLNQYYDPKLKAGRLERLESRKGFRFVYADIGRFQVLEAAVFNDLSKIDRVVHLAAQAGVRHSIDHPQDYLQSNFAGHLNMLELARRFPKLKHMVYASSSSVYGGSTAVPFALDNPVDQPTSLYAASKRSNELTSISYAGLGLILRPARHPAIAVGIEDIGLAQAVRLVGRFLQHVRAVRPGPCDGLVGIAIVEPDLGAETARRRIVQQRQQRVRMIGAVGVQHPFGRGAWGREAQDREIPVGKGDRGPQHVARKGDRAGHVADQEVYP